MREWTTKGLVRHGETFCVSPLTARFCTCPRHRLVHTEVLKGKSTCGETASGSAGFVSPPPLVIDHFREESTRTCERRCRRSGYREMGALGLM